MPDPLPPEVTAWNEAIEAAYRDGWNAAARAARSGLSGRAHSARARGQYEKASLIESCIDALPNVRALRKEPGDAAE